MLKEDLLYDKQILFFVIALLYKKQRNSNHTDKSSHNFF